MWKLSFATGRPDFSSAVTFLWGVSLPPRASLFSTTKWVAFIKSQVPLKLSVLPYHVQNSVLLNCLKVLPGIFNIWTSLRWGISSPSIMLWLGKLSPDPIRTMINTNHWYLNEDNVIIVEHTSKPEWLHEHNLSLLRTFLHHIYNLLLGQWLGLPRWCSGKESACVPMQERQKTHVQSLGQEDSLEEEMATHSSIIAWKTSRREEPGGIQTMGLQRVRHDWGTQHTHTNDYTS